VQVQVQVQAVTTTKQAQAHAPTLQRQCGMPEMLAAAALATAMRAEAAQALQAQELCCEEVSAWRPTRHQGTMGGPQPPAAPPHQRRS
jgi:hypothetical protein